MPHKIYNIFKIQCSSVQELCFKTSYNFPIFNRKGFPQFKNDVKHQPI